MLDWTQIDTVLLDMDGTLLDLHFDNQFWLHHLPRRYAEIHQVSAEQARLQLIARFTAQQGSLEWYCTDYWSEQLDVDIPALKEEINHLVAKRPYVDEFLLALKNSHRKSLIVTNAHHDSVAVKMRQYDLRPLLDAIVVAHDYNAPKEQQAFWQQLHQEHHFDPERTLLIDDNETVLKAAEDFGIVHLVTLLEPDSKGGHRQNLCYPAIHHFDEIMPNDE
ncbi:MAG: GMP/IMP nucleotidase [Pseudomonadales bacterium]